MPTVVTIVAQEKTLKVFFDQNVSVSVIISLLPAILTDTQAGEGDHSHTHIHSHPHPHTAPPQGKEGDADEIPPTQPIIIAGSRLEPLLGQADSATAGQVGRNELRARPILRPGDVIEVVPGMVATQHSSNGKANQYFIRGFNLDHGTDFAIKVDNMPVNLRTHGHGQGYSDLNFLIPELVAGVDYRFGPHDAQGGDFANAGWARMRLLDQLPQGNGLFSATAGIHDYARGLAVTSWQVSDNRQIMLALEAVASDGPWTMKKI